MREFTLHVQTVDSDTANGTPVGTTSCPCALELAVARAVKERGLFPECGFYVSSGFSICSVQFDNGIRYRGFNPEIASQYIHNFDNPDKTENPKPISFDLPFSLVE